MCCTLFMLIYTMVNSSNLNLPNLKCNYCVCTVSAPNIETSDEGVTPTSIMITWDEQQYIDSYKISFERVTGSQQVLCPDVVHTGSATVDGNTTEYLLTGLFEYSTYSITVTAVNRAGEAPSTLTVTTLQAGGYFYTLH